MIVLVADERKWPVKIVSNGRWVEQCSVRMVVQSFLGSVTLTCCGTVGLVG